LPTYTYRAVVTDEMGPRHDCVLVRYGELALKSRRVRARFTQKLREFIVEAFRVEDLDCVVEADDGHLYVYSSDLGAATRRLARVFGVVSVSPAARVDLGEMEGLVADVVAYSRSVLEPGQSFAIRSRRTGNHPFTSMDLAKAAGAGVMGDFEGALSVDLGSPDVELEVEVRGKVAYLYHERFGGVGGLPPGSQGRVLCPVRQRADAVASWLLMRRGCHGVIAVPEGDEEAMGLARALQRWDPTSQVRTVPAEDWQWTTLYQEMGRSRSLAIVSGARGPEVPDLPPDRGEPPVAFFPLVALDDAAYAELEHKVLSK
jgi:thiamine biosynthesis protein ThiI